MILAPGTLVLWSSGGDAVARHLFVIASALDTDPDKPTYRIIMSNRGQLFRYPWPPREVAGRELVPLAAFGRRAVVDLKPTGILMLEVERDRSIEPYAVHPVTGRPWLWGAAWHQHHTDNSVMFDRPEAVELVEAALAEAGRARRKAAA